MNLLPCLAAVRCRTLVLVRVEAAYEMAEATPDGLARVEVIPDAAHELFTGAPDATYRNPPLPRPGGSRRNRPDLAATLRPAASAKQRPRPQGPSSQP